MSVTAAQVKDLRERTGAGMMECKKALVEASGDIDQAIVLLRERGLSRAAKKAGRTAAEGLVEILVNDEQNFGVVLEVNCETDFAAKNSDFTSFVNDAAAVALKEKAPSIEALAELKLAGGRTVGDALTDLISKVGENMSLRRLSSLSTSNGVVAAYNHMGGKIGSLVAIEGDRSDASHVIAKDIAMHIAAAAPRYLHAEQVDPAELEQEKEIARKRLQEEGKPAELIEKILVGQVSKFYKEVCLLDQAFVKDPNISISKLLKQGNLQLSIPGYIRFQLGEGIDKKQGDFAAEVAAAVKGN